jgi:nucleoside 2-deoxyribosyltransferase
MTLKIYLAARYSRRAEMEQQAEFLKTKGFEVTSRWVYGAEEQEGMNESDIAVMDIGDIDKADAVVSFTEPRGNYTRGGGRHVEFGYGLAKDKRLICIGGKENVFHSYPGTEIYLNVEEWLAREQ